jgi:hypothetical protein
VRKTEFGIVYIFTGAHALKVDHGAKSPEEAPFIERFQSPRPDLPKAEFKRLQTDMDNFIKREGHVMIMICILEGVDCLSRLSPSK